MGVVDDNLAREGITVPTPAAPVANYVPAVLTGSLLVVSGQICIQDGKIDTAHRGKLGEDVSIENGQAAARVCAVNLLAQAKAALGGDLDRVVRVVRLGGFINALPDFNALPQVMNGASDLMVQAFGEAGRHARTTVGVAQLPMDCAVEVEAIFEVRR